VCRGDLYDDVLEKDGVICVMCGRNFAAANVLSVQRAKRELVHHEGRFARVLPQSERLAS